MLAITTTVLARSRVGLASCLHVDAAVLRTLVQSHTVVAMSANAPQALFEPSLRVCCSACDMETSKTYAEAQFHRPCMLVPTLVYKDDKMALCKQAQPTVVTKGAECRHIKQVTAKRPKSERLSRWHVSHSNTGQLLLIVWSETAQCCCNASGCHDAATDIAAGHQPDILLPTWCMHTHANAFQTWCTQADDITCYTWCMQAHEITCYT